VYVEQEKLLENYLGAQSTFNPGIITDMGPEGRTGLEQELATQLIGLDHILPGPRHHRFPGHRTMREY